jgi:SAM-dependent methyltransferase
MERGSAADIFATKCRLGWRKRLAGLDYSRSVEYPIALDLLDPFGAKRILEIGASKLPLSLYLLAHTPADIYATDLDPIVRVQSEYAERLGLSGNRLHVNIEDARHLSYPDRYFDRVISVSTIEHVQAVEQAAAEIGRVLVPGGVAVITVPFSRVSQAQSAPVTAYGGTVDQDPSFYQYIFDRTMLFERLLDHTNTAVETIVYLGEPRVRLTRLVYHPVFGRLLRPLAVVWPWLARLSYRIIDEDEVSDGAENIAVVRLRRPLATDLQVDSD